MNLKVILILLLTVLMLTMAACNSNTTPDTEPTDESLTPGVAELDTPVVNPFETNGTEAATDPTDTTDATEPATGETEQPTEETTAPTEKGEDPSEESTDPTEGGEDPTEETTPSEETAPPTEGADQGSTGTTAYEDYLNMTGEQQLAFMQSFDSMEAFFAWLNAAKAEYEAQNPGVDVGDGNIDLGGGN